MAAEFDIIVLGSGMAGVSIAAELASVRKVLILEVDDQVGRHATGRSAALYAESYGNSTVRALTRASRQFFETPPAGFGEAPLLRPRGAMFVAARERVPKLKAMALESGVHRLQHLDTERALQIVPILRQAHVDAAVLDASASDIDVASLHLGYLRQARGSGAQLVRGAGEVSLDRRHGEWHAQTSAGNCRAPVIVNATGAWADVVARQAGVRPVGLQPLRRSAVLVPAPHGQDIQGWPFTIDVDETVYFKPDAGQLLLSPANEDPSEPCDAVPDEMDVALAVDRYESLTTETVSRINHRWAGLRSFVADRSPVAGYDEEVPGFFWMVGQGGYGIQMAPALARAAAALLNEQELPADVAAESVSKEALAPRRPSLAIAGKRL